MKVFVELFFTLLPIHCRPHVQQQVTHFCQKIFSKTPQCITIWSGDPQDLPLKGYWQYLSGKVLKIRVAAQTQTNISLLVRKKPLHSLFVV